MRGVLTSLLCSWDGSILHNKGEVCTMTQHFNQVGNYSFPIDRVQNSDGNIDGEKLSKEQRKLWLFIILSEKSPSSEEKAQYFNFFMNSSGLKAKELSEFSIEPSVVSQWRSGRTNISKQSWELIRGVFYRYFKNNKLTTFSHLIMGKDVSEVVEAIIKEAS